MECFLRDPLKRGKYFESRHKNIRTIYNILKKPKGKISEEASKEVIYKIKCMETYFDNNIVV